jgi:hypothetical protein
VVDVAAMYKFRPDELGLTINAGDRLGKRPSCPSKVKWFYFLDRWVLRGQSSRRECRCT